jgi:pimeloyl-ACP methyl ester carboxylesterase
MDSSNPINIENFFHDTGNGRIFCTLIAPANLTEECVIYFSPLFEERMWSQRIAFNFVRDLVAKGQYSVLLFDYYGYGESSGNSEDFTLDRCRRDIESLLAMLQKKGFRRFVFWGIRTGCAVALSSMPSNPIVSSAFFWAPVFNLHDFIYDSLRATITAQYMLFKQVVAKRDTILEELASIGHCSRDGYTLNQIEGYRFGNTFYQETILHKSSFEPGHISIPVLIIEVAANNTGKGPPVPPQNKDERKPLQENQNIEIKRVIERQFWLIGRDYSQRADSLYKITTEWLNRNG